MDYGSSFVFFLSMPNNVHFPLVLLSPYLVLSLSVLPSPHPSIYDSYQTLSNNNYYYFFALIIVIAIINLLLLPQQQEEQEQESD